MDNKIKYVDLNGLKMFAESLKQDLKNHVIELGLYQELLHRIENLELYKIVDSLPEIGDENTIYLLKNPSGSGDKNVFIEYLYNNEHGWEEIGNFTPSFDLEDYLKIEDSPFEKGDVEHSAVLKGEYQEYSNKAISQTSMAIGAATTAGLKGWYYSKIEFGSNPVITLSDKQPSVILGYLSGGEWSSGAPNIKVGDKVSIVNNSKYDYCGEVKSISSNKVTLKSALPFDSLDTSLLSINNPDDWSIYLPDNESAGIIDFGGGALAEGVNTKSTNIGSHAEGIQTHAYGQYSHTEGFKTEAGYAAHAEGNETIASGENSHAEGKGTKAIGSNSHAEGGETEAGGMRSHAEGANTIASGNTSHAEGVRSIASGPTSHAEGYKTESAGDSSHTEGAYTYASKNAAHAEGIGRLKEDNTIDKTIGALNTAAHAEGEVTTASGKASHAEGSSTKATNYGSHAEGRLTEATEDSSHAEGYKSKATGTASHAEGWKNTASAEASHAEGRDTKATGKYSHAEGKNTQATNVNTHAEGYYSIALGDTAHAEGCRGLALGGFSHVEGYGTTIPDNITELSNNEIEALWDINKNFNIVKGSTSHSEGVNNLVLGDYSHGEGGRVKVNGNYSHAEGKETTASGSSSHAEGYDTTASGEASHAEGSYTTASGSCSHAEGYAKASGHYSHAEGYGSVAKGMGAHAEGWCTIANNTAEHASGRYNKSTESSDESQATQFSIGIGTSDTVRKNAFEVKENGDIYVEGIGGYDGTNTDESEDIATVINDVPFKTGNGKNSAVLKGGNNQVISEDGVAMGNNNIAGLKGFYYKYITLKAGGDTKLANVYLSKTQVSNPTIDTNSGASFKDTSIKPQNYWAVGDIISIVNDAKYDDIATVKQIKDGLVQIEWLDGKSPFSTVKPESDLSSEDYSIYCLDKPTQGISDLGKYSFATGTDNKAINTYTEVSGKGNVAKGKFGKVWGKNNIGGYNTTTFGSGNTNLADNSLVGGTNNINEGNNSVVFGNKNKNYGKRAFVVGNENITNNENEAAFGKYNNSKNDTQFSIGIGTSDTVRKNAFEVKQNGDIYIEGVEGRIQDKLNGGNSSTPDWNAQEGEAGYIENKPFGDERIKLEWYYDDNHDGVMCDTVVDKVFIDGKEYDLTLGEILNIDDTNFGIGYEDYAGKIKVFGANEDDVDWVTNNVLVGAIKQLDERFIPYTIARKSDIPVPIIINYNTIKDAANSEVNTISEQTWLKYIANDTYKNYDWIIQRDGIKYNCTVIPDYDNKHIQILYFTRNEIEGTSGPLGNAIMKYSGLRIKLLPYTENTYLIYKISNGGSLETREFVFGEDYNKNAYLIAAAQMSGIDTIDCKWVYTTKADKTITVNGQYFHIENSITNVDAIFSVKDKSLTYVDGNGLINKVTFADNGSYDISKNNPDIPDTIVKTTPQSLSDNDKNQALANLGIDPVIWKYMCEPYHLTQDSGIPDDLRSVIFDENDKLKDIVLKLVVFEINDGDYGSFIYPAARLSGYRDAVLPSDDYIEYAVTIYPDGTTTDW